MQNDLLLLTKNDIPFMEAQINIHNPTINEIGLIGEENFYTGCEMLTFSKDILNQEDRSNLENQNDFEILMSILAENNSMVRKNRIAAMLVLTLMFPEYEIKFSKKEILLTKEDEIHSINSENFERFKEIIKAMFCLGGAPGEEKPTYNPGGELAQKIAEKLKKRHETLAKSQGEQKIAVLNRYASILAVGLKLDINKVLNYTVYQLFDQYQRYDLEDMADKTWEARLAGARDLKEVDNWKKDIHP